MSISPLDVHSPPRSATRLRPCSPALDHLPQRATSAVAQIAHPRIRPYLFGGGGGGWWGGASVTAEGGGGGGGGREGGGAPGGARGEGRGSWGEKRARANRREGGGGDAGFPENLLRVSRTDAVDVRESVQNFLVAWQIRRPQCVPCRAIPAAVCAWDCAADDADDTPPLDHLTMLTDRFDAGPNLQTARSRKKIPIGVLNYRRARKFTQGAGLRRTPQLDEHPFDTRFANPRKIVSRRSSLVPATT